MYTPINKSDSANAIKSSHLDDSLYQEKNTTGSRVALFQGRSTSGLSQSVNSARFKKEAETANPCQPVVNDRSFASRKEHISPLSNVTSTPPGTTDDQRGRHQNPLTAPSPISLQPNQRETYIINMHTFRSENDSLPSNASESACFRNHNWWERNKKWNSTFIISTLATAAAVTASLISDIINDGDHALFQRSGSIIVCWALLVTFITLRKRSEKLPSHELMIEPANQKISREEGMRLMDLSEQIGNARITERKVKRSASECDLLILLVSIIGTLIWGYGDLITRKTTTP
ncbi:hypothetical protein [Endozoicomonas sp. ONNA2]|uniref:hypothetical protein n=1 Tax=Endozoicomonas sp. ONNA2 TaxID=2828741 RepID=UPI002149383A|nr:hypothetical protein [Endozoicomonas sp. ONNA2]